MNAQHPVVWKPKAFVLTRRQARNGVASVPPRRVLVLCPWPEAGVRGAGLQRDEVAREVPVGLGEGLFSRQGIGPGELADFFQAFGCALRAGQPLLGAFSMAARQARTARMRGVIGGLAQLVAQGFELHQAMARFPMVFSSAQISLSQAAAKAGLDEAGALFVDLAASLQKDGRLGRKLTGALAYPIVLLLMALVAAVVLELKALPPMVELFKAMGAKLPPVTQAFYQVSRVLIEWGVFIFPLLAALVPCLVMMIKTWTRTPGFQRLAVRSWLVGPIIQARSLSRALGIFLLLKQCGSTSRDMFLLAAEASGNALIADFFRSTYQRVVQGEGLEEAFLSERHQLGDDGIRLAGRMDVGMAGGDLKLLLKSYVEELNDQAELRLALLPKALELPMLALCGLIIGSIILAIFLPYPSLLGDAARQMHS